MYVLYGQHPEHQPEREELDTAHSLKYARFLQREYRVAFGPGWIITFKKERKQ